MAKDTNTAVLDKKAKVVARVDLRDVPAGTTGKVVLVNGLTWIRYWVRFDNGIQMGSVNRSHLATPAEWKRVLSGEDEAEVATTAGAADDGAGDDAGAGEGVTINGVLVPAKLIERTKAARARLGV